MTTDHDISAARRHVLADMLDSASVLRSDGWRQALLAVPREAFLPRFYEQTTNPAGFSQYRPISAETVGFQRWLDLVYQDQTWVTQLAHDDASWDADAPVSGVPSSSSTRPSAVVRMLEDLDVADGMRVLEVGTGTGYSAALAAYRLGDRQVTSIEHDPALSRRAARRLATLGLNPTLVAGDGAAGHRAGGPYERVIATYSPASVPAAWLDQTTPGGALLLALAGGLNTYGYIRLTVDGDHTAHGRFLSDDVSFMPSRAQIAPEFAPLMRAAHAQYEHTRVRDSEIDPALFDNAAFRWNAQLFLPDVTTVTTAEDGLRARWFLHPDGSWAAVNTHSDGPASVRDGGPLHLWTELERAARWWHQHDRPAIDQYHLHVTPSTNTYTVETADTSWTRPS